MALIVQSFGNETEYRRAVLAVLSYYAHRPVIPLATVLFTDNPDYFRSYFDGLPITYQLLTPGRIKEMRGDIDFLHRMKIAIIEQGFALKPGNLLYVDSDTFFLNDPSDLMGQLSDNQSSMHLKEYRLDDMKNFALPAGKSFQELYYLIRSEKESIAAETGIMVDGKLYSWNAGVMMLHNSVTRLLPAVYKITEIFYPRTKNHASEQYAFSIVLQTNTTLVSCDHLVYHYWYRVKKTIVDRFLEKNISKLEQKESEDKLNVVLQWSRDLPQLFESHILMLRDRAIQCLNENRFREGYRWALRAFFKDPFDWSFVRHVLYHARRQIKFQSDTDEANH